MLKTIGWAYREVVAGLFHIALVPQPQKLVCRGQILVSVRSCIIFTRDIQYEEALTVVMRDRSVAITSLTISST